MRGAATNGLVDLLVLMYLLKEDTSTVTRGMYQMVWSLDCCRVT
jgi:hypothetical protein